MTGPDLSRALLAAWLVLAAAPLGALPVLMALDLAGRGRMPGAEALRLVLCALPLAALLGAAPLVALAVRPDLVDVAALYGWSGGGTQGLAARWYTLPWFTIRSLVALAVFVALGLVFLRGRDDPPRWRRAVAALGLGLYLALGTMTAVDWTMSLEPGLNSSAFGLVLLTLQAAFAVTLALLITLMRGPSVSRELVLILLAIVAAATFMQFSQYLVVWSANLPREVAWYRHRFAGLGRLLFEAVPIVLAIAVALLVPPALGRRRAPVLVAALLLLGLEGATLLWLVTPAWRGAFAVSGLEGLALLGLGGAMAAGMAVVHSLSREARHG